MSNSAPTAPSDRPAPPPSLAWFFASLVIAAAANATAGWTTYTTIGLMASVSEFARSVRAVEIQILPWFRIVAYTTVSAFLLWYLRPLIAYFRVGCPQPVDESIKRVAVSAPVAIAFSGLAPWCFSTLFYPPVTLALFGRWSLDLMSQQVLSPLVNGFFAATTVYLLVDWVFRRSVIPHVFPHGHVAEVPGAITLNVRGRLLVFLAAVAFIPLFTMLGLARSATVRFESGVPIAQVVHELAGGSTGVFFVYTGLGVILTLMLARTFTEPISEVARALRRVQAGDLEATVEVEASDEVGRLQDGVNAMISGLREKDRIFHAFGRVVEPAVRDRILAGDIALGGESRHATVMFCDMRGFTALAEAVPPAEVVATLNALFTVLTGWVRECGGFVDKFIGDAMFVVFGLFDEGEGAEAESAARALRCALGVRERLAELNADRNGAGAAALSVSMGLHTGEVLAGTIGASDRHEYTVIGDTVNVAARLQALCKERAGDLLISERAWLLAQEAGTAADAAARDSVTLRGRSVPISFIEVA